MVDPVLKSRQAPYDTEAFIGELKQRYAHQPMFVQAVEEFLETIIPFVNAHPKYLGKGLLERMVEPDRIIRFRISWLDSEGRVRVNRGYRVQFNNAIGPYKGGLRFHPGLSEDVVKFLAFEQVFKNSLTTLPMGGAKGGADIDPKELNDIDIMLFCQAYMNELFHYVGPDFDVPAGDIGVSQREIGYLYGQYKKLTHLHVGVLTGKGMEFGGSMIRPEATGYGCVYFAKEVLAYHGMELEGKQCLVSGAGNVALHTAEKLIEEGAVVLTVSDSRGTAYMPKGMRMEELQWLKQQKFERKCTLEEFAERYGFIYLEGEQPWGIKADYAFPCATQHEINAHTAGLMVRNGVRMVVEGANMPVTLDASKVFQQSGVIYVPGKASNAGGVAISGLEMTQNSMRMSWTREEVDGYLRKIMKRIHERCVEFGVDKDGRVDYVKGANIGGFIKVADAMLAQGVI